MENIWIPFVLTWIHNPQTYKRTNTHTHTHSYVYLDLWFISVACSAQNEAAKQKQLPFQVHIKYLWFIFNPHEKGIVSLNFQHWKLKQMIYIYLFAKEPWLIRFLNAWTVNSEQSTWQFGYFSDFTIIIIYHHSMNACSYVLKTL